MKKSETLRGYKSFKRIMRSGMRIEGEVLRAFVVVEKESSSGLRVGFAVQGSFYAAVERNRLKRLMRVAITLKRNLLLHQIERIHHDLTVVVLFKGLRNLPIERVTLSRLSEDVGTVCNSLAQRL